MAQPKAIRSPSGFNCKLNDEKLKQAIPDIAIKKPKKKYLPNFALLLHITRKRICHFTKMALCIYLRDHVDFTKRIRSAMQPKLHRLLVFVLFHLCWTCIGSHVQIT